MVRSLLFQACLPSSFWVEALHVASDLINILPTKILNDLTPHEVLHKSPPSYTNLHVFGCLYYPNVASTAPHKLTSRAIPCIFLGYPSNQKGFRCLDPVTSCLIISHHVTIDKSQFP